MTSQEHPILFSGPMTRAILEGRKTQTRRVVKPQPVLRGLNGGPLLTQRPADGRTWTEKDAAWSESEDDLGWYITIPGYSQGPFRCPFGVPGDLLWVRESHWKWTGCGRAPENFTASPSDPYDGRCYDDHPNLDGLRDGACVVRRPSIHMPKWACRLRLRVEDVRVERLQEITEEDAKAEGVAMPDGIPEPPDFWSYRQEFAHLWDEINGKRAPWSSNPWVWVVRFSRVDHD